MWNTQGKFVFRSDFWRSLSQGMACFGRLVIGLWARHAGCLVGLFVIMLVDLGQSAPQWQVQLWMLQEIKTARCLLQLQVFLQLLWQAFSCWERWPCLCVWVGFVLSLGSLFLHDTHVAPWAFSHELMWATVQLWKCRVVGGGWPGRRTGGSLSKAVNVHKEVVYHRLCNTEIQTWC